MINGGMFQEAEVEEVEVPVGEPVVAGQQTSCQILSVPVGSCSKGKGSPGRDVLHSNSRSTRWDI
eukprot:10681869-Ditylum_brightwellii.AAC.1